MAKGKGFSRESAEKLAISALGFLAQDEERLGQFLSVTGIGPDMIRKAAADPSEPVNTRFFATNANGMIYENTTSLFAVMPEVGIPGAGHTLY